MRKLFCWQAILLLLVLLGNACNKDVTMPEQVADGQINFYFASTAAVNGANALDSKGYKVLIDSRDSTYELPEPSYQSFYPYLLFPGKDRPLYPNSISEWVRLMRLPTGMHQLFLVDTAHRVVDSASLTLAPTVPAMVFLGDSAGHYRHIIGADPYTATAGIIGLRIINLSPFTGPVFVTVNKTIPPTLPASTSFMDHTGFMPVDFPAPATVNIKVYQPGDSTQFLASAATDMLPGHAYTLLINGYSDTAPSSYVDPLTGRKIPIVNNFSLMLFKNF